jgi:hypothetical protein
MKVTLFVAVTMHGRAQGRLPACGVSALLATSRLCTMD